MSNIAIEGDRSVSERAHEVTDVHSHEVHEAVTLLFATMAETGAMGFAAPQIHIPLRIFIFSSYPHVNHEDAAQIPSTVVINPVMHSKEDPEKTWEKCYSLPGVRGLVPRYKKINVSYTTRDGNRIENRTLEGFAAGLFQHEYDHLDGVLYKARVEPQDREHDIIPEDEYKRQFGDDQLIR
ncbi:MAG TPA: peptide deformylase [Candidatus Saccharimonadales bacterium]|nr:peptide deformylase [Candidatus Saccharimonadales bacterium]